MHCTALSVQCAVLQCALHSALNSDGTLGHVGLVCLCRGFTLLLPGVDFVEFDAAR